MKSDKDFELTLLSENEIFGVGGTKRIGQLKVFKKYGRIAAITDLVLLTGGDYIPTAPYYVPDDNSLKGRPCWYYTRSSDGNGDMLAVDSTGYKDYFYRYYRHGAVRPALLSSTVFKEISQNRVSGYNGIEEVEYGEYPQYAPDFDMQRILEKEYQKGSLQTTGGDYTFNRIRWNDYEQPFHPVKYEEYEFQGKRYIRVKANIKYDECYLSNGETYKNGDYVWLEVSPVVWIIDNKRKKLISKRCLLSGIRFHTDKEKYNGDFSKTEMKWFLDNHMLHDLFQCYNIKKENNITENQNEIINLVKEIKEYMKYYHGNIDVKKRVENLIQDYNQKLEVIANTSNSNNLELSVESNNIYRLRQKLVLDLESILLELKSYSSNIKSYYDMNEILKECQKTADIDIKKDELCKMVYSIKSVFKCILNDRIRNDLTSKLDKIIDENIKKNEECIRNFESLNIRSRCTKNIEELKLEFRRDIHPFLIKLNDIVLNQDVIRETMNSIKLILDENYHDTKNNQVKYFLEISQAIVENVRKHGNNDDIAKLNELLTFEIDYSKDIMDILKELNEVIINEYKLEFDILERNNHVKEINSKKVRVDIGAIFDEQELEKKQEQHKVLSKTL